MKPGDRSARDDRIPEQLHLPALTRINPISREMFMGRYLLLWLLGVPLPILVLIYAFGGLH